LITCGARLKGKKGRGKRRERGRRKGIESKWKG